MDLTSEIAKRNENVLTILRNDSLSMGKKIACLRNLHYMSQRNFSRIIGVTEQELFLYEHDVMKPPVLVLHRMSSFFGITIWKW
jgi:DNA-binding XRE family transcriptional regulator